MSLSLRPFYWLIRLHSIAGFLFSPFFFFFFTCLPPCLPATLSSCLFISAPRRDAMRARINLLYITTRRRLLSKQLGKTLLPLPVSVTRMPVSFLLVLSLGYPPIGGYLRGFDDPRRPINQNFNALSAFVRILRPRFQLVRRSIRAFTRSTRCAYKMGE